MRSSFVFTYFELKLDCPTTENFKWYSCVYVVYLYTVLFKLVNLLILSVSLDFFFFFFFFLIFKTFGKRKLTFTRLLVSTYFISKLAFWITRSYAISQGEKQIALMFSYCHSLW